MTAATATWIAGVCLVVAAVAAAAFPAHPTLAVQVAVGFVLFGFGLWLDLTE